ncbi:hypothetical protein H0H87_011718, partial [Tephrocybe sp. NHM501043]
RTMTRFGDFAPLCTSTPSYPWCNLFYRQLQRTSVTTFLNASADPKTAGVGINPTCFIPPTFTTDPDAATPHLGNIANILACGLSFIFTLLLIWLAHRRKAAVGRIEIRTLLGIYAVTLPLNAITTGAFLQQGSTALVVLTALHAGFVAAFFWALLANALVATQVVEDGTWSSLVVRSFVFSCFRIRDSLFFCFRTIAVLHFFGFDLRPWNIPFTRYRARRDRRHWFICEPARLLEEHITVRCLDDMAPAVRRALRRIDDLHRPRGAPRASPHGILRAFGSAVRS